jgi:hypothetical protein
MTKDSFANPFITKIQTLTHLLVISIGINIAFGGTAFYRYFIQKQTHFSKEQLPLVELKKEHADLLQSFFQKNFTELVAELSNKEQIADGYKVCDLALGILTSYNYLDLSKALMGESLEEREVMFIHTHGGERFSVCLYPDIEEYHYSLIKGFIKETKYPLTSEGLFAELKVLREKADVDLIASFMLSKEFIAIYTFIKRYFNNLEKEKLLLTLLSGSYIDVERFYYLYLENMDKPKQMIRHFFKTYCKHGSTLAAEMWLQIDEDYILHQLDNYEIAMIIELTSNKSFLEKIQNGVRGEKIRGLAKDSPKNLEVIKQEPVKTLENYKEYIVQKGDCLWKIAHKHQMSTKAIVDFNNLKTDLLREGQILKLPAE